MRIRRLELRAFGPFTDRTLEFRGDKPGLHIIYGPNEAGKSSSLRGLKALLYGFPERTADGFQHANENLLVAGCLQAEDGREICFQRRKRRKADILDGAGNPLADGALFSFLPGIDQGLFESLYGIDHAVLVQGGEEILAQKGEVGQTLFAAGSGISSLRSILDSLEGEADELFKARGSRQLLNTAIAEYRELLKTVKQTSLSSRQWQEHRKQLDDAERERQRLQNEREAKQKQVHHLERLKRAIPFLARRAKHLLQLEELGEVQVLPLDFAGKKREVEQQQRETLLQLQQAGGRLERLARKKEGVGFNQVLVDHAWSIVDLHQRLGQYRTEGRDREKNEGMRIGSRTEAAELLKRIRPDLALADVELLRSVLLRKKTIQELINGYHTRELQVAQAKKHVGEVERQIKSVAEDLEQLPAAKDVSSLARAVKHTGRTGAIDADIKAKIREIESDKKECASDLNRLGCWSGELHQVVDLPLPLPETIKKFAARYQDLEDARRQLANESRETDRELQQAVDEKKKIEYGGEVPTEEELALVRGKRDNGWALLCRKWLSGEDVDLESRAYDPLLSLPAAYGKYVTAADTLADRLRREADRAAGFAAIRARLESLEAKKKDIVRRQEEFTGEMHAIALAWQAIWRESGIKPLSPAEMASWLNEFSAIRARVKEVARKEQELAEKKELRHTLQQSLVMELELLGEVPQKTSVELEPVIVFSETVVTEHETNQAGRMRLGEKKKELRESLAAAAQDLQLAEKTLTQWQGQWQDAVQGMVIAGSTLAPADANSMLDDLQNCFAKIKDAEVSRKRIAGMTKNMEKYEQDVKSLLQRVVPELLSEPPDQAVTRLQAMLGKANEDRALLAKYVEDMANLEEEIRHGEDTLKSLNGQMGEFLRLAGCQDGAELDKAIDRSAEWRKIREMLNEVETTLAEIAEGLSLEDITRETLGLHSAELQGQIDAFKREINEELSPRIDEFFEVIGREKNELGKMDGGSLAAEAAEKSERVLAGIRRLADRYVRVKLAARVLEQEIERYREEHQDPILRLASGYFAELTLGSFAGLRTDIDENGKPVLAGLRPDDSRVYVQGMSSGTRDQLYLALRLATLEWRLQSSDSMPFIVDDILINFDDRRVKATLNVLARLAEKTQVVLFTHHSQVVEDARSLASEGHVLIHEL
ncbi:MAG: AAA family ATPase [Deltaproteobacteria bacterium]|nr:AAA family ATPase [Deltaproteobacteria bacterium]